MKSAVSRSYVRKDPKAQPVPIPYRLDKMCATGSEEIFVPPFTWIFKDFQPFELFLACVGSTCMERLDIRKREPSS